MCGGRGTRLDAETEKPLFEVGDKPMVARVADALAESRIEVVHAVVSPHTPETREFAEERGSLAIVETPGEGYVADLQTALEAVELPVLTVAADLPLLEADAVNSVLDAHESPEGNPGRGSVTVCVPAALKRALGVSADTTFQREDCEDREDRETCEDREDRGDREDRETRENRELAPTGINVVAETDSETMYETYDARFAVNVNRTSDADLAKKLL